MSLTAVVAFYRRCEQLGMPALTLPTTEQAQRLSAWLNEYRTLANARDRANWALADCVAIARKAGLPVTAAATGNALDMSPVKLREQLRVALAFPPTKRDPQLSYEAHAHLATFPDDNRFVILARAAAEGWGDRTARKAATACRQERAGFEDEDHCTSLAVHIMRAWNRATPDARRYFAELQEVAGFGLVDEDA